MCSVMVGLLKWLKAGAKNKAADLWGLVSRQAHLSAGDRVQHEDTTAGPETSLQRAEAIPLWFRVMRTDTQQPSAPDVSSAVMSASPHGRHKSVCLCAVDHQWEMKSALDRPHRWSSSTLHSHHPSGACRFPPPAIGWLISGFHFKCVWCLWPCHSAHTDPGRACRSGDLPPDPKAPTFPSSCLLFSLTFSSFSCFSGAAVSSRRGWFQTRSWSSPHPGERPEVWRGERNGWK